MEILYEWFGDLFVVIGILGLFAFLYLDMKTNGKPWSGSSRLTKKLIVGFVLFMCIGAIIGSSDHQVSEPEQSEGGTYMRRYRDDGSYYEIEIPQAPPSPRPSQYPSPPQPPPPPAPKARE